MAAVKFVATEYVGGETLRQKIARSRLDLRDALDVAVQVASALAAAHKAEVVHRGDVPDELERIAEKALAKDREERYQVVKDMALDLKRLRKRLTGAQEQHQKVAPIVGENASYQCFMGYAYAKSGERDKALATLDKLKTTKESVSPAELAVVYVGLGDKEGAYQALERAYSAHDLQLQYLNVDPHYDDLHSDPRFRDLVRRVGLPQ